MTDRTGDLCIAAWLGAGLWLVSSRGRVLSQRTCGHSDHAMTKTTLSTACGGNKKSEVTETTGCSGLRPGSRTGRHPAVLALCDRHEFAGGYTGQRGFCHGK